MARILIVDDEQCNVGILSLVVSQLGHEAIEAYSGQQALNLVSVNPPDLILLDYMMPGIDGLETLQRIRSIPGGEMIPVFLITASQGHNLQAGAIENRMSGFLRKPLGLDTVKALIEEHCQAESSPIVV